MKLVQAMQRTPATGGRMWTAWSAFVALALALVSATAFAQAPAAAGGAAPALPAAELEKLVGPIALYPDDLVAIILPASTSPLQIVQADRWLDKRKSDPKLPIDEKWDDPVKSLLNYPDVVKKMSNDLDWTSALGEAVVADQGAVIEAVQVFRRKAKAAGNLKTDDKQVVKTQQEVIIIEPANPQVIYVPQYNPSTVVVYSAAPVYGYYPAPYPAYYYPYAPGAALAAGVVWGAAIGAAWSGNRYGYGGGEANINVNNTTNVSRGGNTVNTGGNTANRGSGQGGGSSQWKSNKQPGQVSSSVGKSSPSNRAGDARGGAGASAGGGARASTQPAGGADRGGAGGADRGGGAGAGGGRDSAGGGRDRVGGAAVPVVAATVPAVAPVVQRGRPRSRGRAAVAATAPWAATTPVGRRRRTARAARRAAVRRTAAAVAGTAAAVAGRVRARAVGRRVAAAERPVGVAAVAAAAAVGADQGAMPCPHLLQSQPGPHP